MVLTDEALERLSQRLLEAWRESGMTGRFSRNAGAAILEIGDRTLEKILKRQGNDHAVLVQVFAKLGLPWDDSLCCPVEEFERRRASEGTHQTGSRPVMVAPTEDRRPDGREGSPQRTQAVRRFGRVAALAVLVGVAWWVGAVAQRPPDRLSRLSHQAVQTMEAGRRAFLAADYPEAQRLISSAVEIADEAGLVEVMAESIRLEGDILSARGNLDESIERYRRALTLWRTIDRPHGLGTLLEVLGVAEARAGRIDAAEEHLRESLDVLTKAGMGDHAAGTMRSLGSVSAVQGRHDEARAWFSKASRAIAHRPGEAMHTHLRALNALVDADQGRIGPALDALEDCLADWERREHPRWVATTLMHRARVLTWADRPSEAESDVRRARALYAQVGDARGVAKCDAWLTQPQPPVDDQERRRKAFF